jgi:hypothetical protein
MINDGQARSRVAQKRVTYANDDIQIADLGKRLGLTSAKTSYRNIPPAVDRPRSLCVGDAMQQHGSLKSSSCRASRQGCYYSHQNDKRVMAVLLPDGIPSVGSGLMHQAIPTQVMRAAFSHAHLCYMRGRTAITSSFGAPDVALAAHICHPGYL